MNSFTFYFVCKIHMTVYVYVIMASIALLLLMMSPVPQQQQQQQGRVQQSRVQQSRVQQSRVQQGRVQQPSVLKPCITETWLYAHMWSLVDAFTHTGEYTYLIDLATIYERGSYPDYAPGYHQAQALYLAGSHAHHPDVARHCRMAFSTLAPQAQEDIVGPPLPSGPGDAMLQQCLQQQKHHHRVEDHDPIEPPHIPEHIIPNDAQNVHDHGVMAHLRTHLEPDRFQGTTIMDDVRAYTLESDHSPDTKQHALDVLESLSTNVHSTLNVSEQDVLHQVWNKCKDTASKDMLVSQMASAVEDGQLVCSTGKIARMMGTFDGLDDSQPIRPMWAVKEEIASLAAKMRDSPDQFKHTVMTTYVEDLGMREDTIRALADEYALYM